MSHKRNISVVGLGYVGLPVAVAFGFHSRVVGFDINPERIAELQNGVDRTHEVDPADLTKTDILFTSDPKGLAQADFHIVAVPTPIDESNRPDLTPVIKASQTVGGKLKKGDIVVYESTVYPGATEEVCVPILEKMSGLTFGRDFTVGYSPERINPGDKEHTFTRITKVVSGSDGPTLEVVAAVYASVITAGVHKAANIKTAEAAKVIENTQRDLNIALINELSMIFHRMGLDTNQVLQAAGTKWNFLPFRPGLVGGHCIGVDPYYLTYKAQMLGYHPEVILAGRRINDGMGRYVAEQVVKGLIRQGNPVKGARVIVFGFTFKEDVPDLRNTRVVDVVRELTEYGLHVQIHDPEARPDEALHEYGMTLTPTEELAPADAVVLAVAHKPYQLRGWGL
ncbi:MAG: nucleotide sugar dehydrogenase, partial [Deltaproteobacteria bacterium]|nr:nucleotide sugar dehydrogenase [Deltaproteobacteria bacterium]